MIVAFLIQNRHRRRIARAIRLIKLTQAVIPKAVQFSTTMARAYASAWRG